MTISDCMVGCPHCGGTGEVDDGYPARRDEDDGECYCACHDDYEPEDYDG